MAEIKIVIKIPDAKMDDLKAAFTKVVKRHPDHEGLTDLQFFKVWIKDVIFNVYKTGKIAIAKDTTKPDIDLNIVDVE